MTRLPEKPKDASQAEVEIRITQPFFMSRYELTVGQIEKGGGFGTTGFDSGNGFGSDARRANTGMNWNRAVHFCNKLSLRMGLEEAYAEGVGIGSTDCRFASMGFRLPTEAEWEWAFRGGRTGADGGLHQSESNLGEFAWGPADSFLFQKGIQGWGDQWVPGPQIVGMKEANGFGIYDMVGNVSEMCWDFYSPGSVLGGADPRGPPDGETRLLKGGSFLRIPPDVFTGGGRSETFPGAMRDLIPPDAGFRIILPVPPVGEAAIRSRLMSARK